MTREKSEGNPKLVVADCIEIYICDGIVYVVYADGAEVGLEIQREIHEAYREITGGKKMPFLLMNKGAFYISKDARNFARKHESEQPIAAMAHAAPTLDIRLMAEFYGKFYKPDVPYKVFSSKEEAIEWLQQFL